MLEEEFELDVNEDPDFSMVDLGWYVAFTGSLVYDNPSASGFF
jgi:hypothetical protein